MTSKQTTNTHKFLLVGNGSYQNRGCEAIVRGTMEILSREFGSEIQVGAGVYACESEIQKQTETETDPAVRSYSLSGTGPRLSRKWWAAQANKRLGTKFTPQYWALNSIVKTACAALEVGGDNYSLDYGRPESFMAMDNFLQAQGLPIILWGASIGPFDSDSAFAPRMFAHLRTLTAILVRETASLDYLRANGISNNVHLVADPAFVMKPVEPCASKLGFTLQTGAIGINLSPLVARYRGLNAGPSNLKEWLGFCIGLIKSAATLDRPILLIPHVESDYPENDDFAFLQSLCDAVANEVAVPIKVLPRGLRAAELKWIIGRCEIFAGARTHATIAALSSQVPTLSIGYSLKARGINQDIFKNLQYCLPVSELNAENFIDRLKNTLVNQKQIRSDLASRIPEMQAKAFSAGTLLKKILKIKKV